jgi:hypothetical protein
MTHCACRSRARAGHQTVTGPVTSTCLHDRRGRAEATQTALGEALVMHRRTRVRFPPPPPRGLRRLCGDPSQNDEPPRTARLGAVCCRAGSVGGTSPGRGAHATLGLRNAGPVTKSHPTVRPPRRQRVVSGAADASTTAAEDVTRGRPTALSRTGCRCASRTAGRSCRPDWRAARRPGVAGCRNGIRTGRSGFRVMGRR